MGRFHLHGEFFQRLEKRLDSDPFTSAILVLVVFAATLAITSGVYPALHQVDQRTADFVRFVALAGYGLAFLMADALRKQGERVLQLASTRVALVIEAVRRRRVALLKSIVRLHCAHDLAALSRLVSQLSLNDRLFAHSRSGRALPHVCMTSRLVAQRPF